MYQILYGIEKQAEKKGYYIKIDNQFNWCIRFVPRDSNKDIACFTDEGIEGLIKQASKFIINLK